MNDPCRNSVIDALHNSKDPIARGLVLLLNENEEARMQRSELLLAVSGNKNLGIKGLVDLVGEHERRLSRIEKGVVWVSGIFVPIAFAWSIVKDRICKMIFPCIAIMVIMVLCGCESTHSSMTAPNLIVISESVDSATSEVTKATTITKKVYRDGAKKNDPQVKLMEEYLMKALNDLQVAKAEIKTKQDQINTMTAQANKVVDRLNYIEPKYAASVGLVWKWRFISLGLVLFIGAYGVAKFYFHIPFI